MDDALIDWGSEGTEMAKWHSLVGAGVNGGTGSKLLAYAKGESSRNSLSSAPCRTFSGGVSKKDDDGILADAPGGCSCPGISKAVHNSENDKRLWTHPVAEKTEAQQIQHNGLINGNNPFQSKLPVELQIRRGLACISVSQGGG